MKSQTKLALENRDDCVAMAKRSRVKDAITHGGNGNKGERLKEKEVLAYLNGPKSNAIKKQIQDLASSALGSWSK
jgi:hypothetical protein